MGNNTKSLIEYAKENIAEWYVYEQSKYTSGINFRYDFDWAKDDLESRRHEVRAELCRFADAERILEKTVHTLEEIIEEYSTLRKLIGATVVYAEGLDSTSYEEACKAKGIAEALNEKILFEYVPIDLVKEFRERISSLNHRKLPNPPQPTLPPIILQQVSPAQHPTSSPPADQGETAPADNGEVCEAKDKDITQPHWDKVFKVSYSEFIAEKLLKVIDDVCICKTDYGRLEKALYEYGYIKKPNSHKNFIKTLYSIYKELPHSPTADNLRHGGKKNMNEIKQAMEEYGLANRKTGQ